MEAAERAVFGAARGGDLDDVQSALALMTRAGDRLGPYHALVGECALGAALLACKLQQDQGVSTDGPGGLSASSGLGAFEALATSKLL